MVNQLSGSGNTNNGEEDVLENDMVQGCVALLLRIANSLASVIEEETQAGFTGNAPWL